MRKDEAYFQIIKAFIEANNEELSDLRRQLAAKKKLLGRRIREPEVISETNYVFP
jgi:HPt (histidine-containing phosphotransfer) domain-containing protein